MAHAARLRALRRALPEILVVAGVLITWACLGLEAGSVLQRVGVLVGGALALASLFVRGRGGSVPARKRVLARRARRVEQRRVQIASELDATAQRLGLREQELREKLLALYRASEYPEPLDLGGADALGALSNARLAELVERDQLVHAEIEREGKQLFDKVKGNVYLQDGALDLRRVGDDLFDFAQRIARIYKPDAEQPLLETNASDVLQAASRACIHVLVVLDTLPVDAKGYSLQSVYSFVRKGVRAYDTYKAASPYLDGVFHAGRLGRLALGANPIVLGTSWVVSSLVQRSASSLVGRYVHRQGLLFLHDLVRVVAFEVASLYGARFRHRDPNWIYGVELTELARVLPLTRRGLRRAVAEVDALSLRNEYDRVYLLRMLAKEHSAGPERFEAAALLSASERRGIAERLVEFSRRAGQHEGAAEDVARWSEGLEQRLGVGLAGVDETSTRAAEDLRAEALVSLASFLFAEAGLEHEEIASRLAPLRSAQGLDPDPAALETLARQAPAFFEAPRFTGPAQVVEGYVADLVDLWLGTDVAQRPSADLVLDAGACVGHPVRDTRRLLESRSREALAQRTDPAWSSKRLSPDVAAALLALLRAGERLTRVYTDAELHAAPAADPQPCVLAVSDARLFAFTSLPMPRLLWESGRHVTSHVSTRALSRTLELTGGSLRGDSSPDVVAPRLEVSRARVRGAGVFAPVLGFLDRAT